ncbi:MAG: 2-C-methyl-D-erythritol 2,4-cyclodiphosphate synthase [Elusimicrobia bacterium HGW-Elusimicrobia-4]|nr:MAG: 2-C-methyl-D-erythritol 2,4-cyclodiphosphate synthase [Elusimicrobia bacterium HGW-Elusimicrobia-4]
MNSKLRIGFGYDIHKLVKGRPLFLGGIKIPYSKGPLAHSDGDVLLHAICDSLLGSAGLGDIGKHFPNTDKKYKNISSLVLLKKTFVLLKKSGYKIINIDTMLVAKEPKISPYIKKMKKEISKIIGTKNISIKATTNEGIGELGKGKAICAYAICLIQRKNV